MTMPLNLSKSYACNLSIPLVVEFHPKGFNVFQQGINMLEGPACNTLKTITLLIKEHSYLTILTMRKIICISRTKDSLKQLVQLISNLSTLLLALIRTLIHSPRVKISTQTTGIISFNKIN